MAKGSNQRSNKEVKKPKKDKKAKAKEAAAKLSGSGFTVQGKEL